LRLYFEHAFSEKEAGRLPLCFDMAVLERYREGGRVSLMRTRNAGLLQSREGWRLDFGIVDEEALIHASAADVFSLPQAERVHFAAHLRFPPLNERFLEMRLGGAGCIDDGEIESWDGQPR